MCITIKTFINNREWMYLWGKYVTGINLNAHCAKALKGEYTKKINKEMDAAFNIKLDEADSKIFYLCGVTKPYKWKDNFHLALRYKKGSHITVSRNGLYLEVEDAEELPICFDLDKCNHEKKDKKEYATCRNWQFAYLYQDLFKA